MSFDNIRIGRKYCIYNFGEQFEFSVEKKRTESDFVVKDIHTLEMTTLKELVKYGLGKDFQFYEIEK